MVLTGLGLSQALALFAAAGAIAIALYLLRLRRRSVPVPFLALWEELLGEPSATRLFSRLRHLFSLLVALLVLALLTAALTAPEHGAASSSVRHTLVLVDAGLTMQATDVAPSRLGAAIALARDVVAEAGPNHRMLVAQIDATPLPLGPFTGERDTLEAALAKVTPTDRVTRPEPAYRFAIEVLRGRSDPRVLVISDRAAPPDEGLTRALEDAAIDLAIARIGQSDANFAVTELALRRYPLDARQSELLLAVRNAGTAPGRVEVALFADGAPVAVDTLALAAGATERRFYDDLGGVGRTLEARLRVLDDGRDDLAADDRAYAVVPERRRARILCVSEGNRYLEAALLLDEYLDVDLVTPAAYTAAQGYDAVIFDRFVPPEPPGTDAIYLHPEGGPGHTHPIETRGIVEAPRFEHVVRAHPLVRWIALRDVNVARALELRPAPGDTVVASDPRTPLVVAGTREGHRFVALGFDVRESDLPLRTAWPLLLLNALDWLRQDATALERAYDVGEPIRITLPQGTQSAEVTDPEGKRRPLAVHGGEATTSSARAGLLRVSAEGVAHVVAVNRGGDATGDLAPGPRDDTWRVQHARPSNAHFDYTLWTLLLVAALALLTGEWISYHRRWTV